MPKKTCRLCLCDQQIVYNAFEHDIKDLPVKIQKTTSIQLKTNDGILNTVCVNCVEMVVQFDVFKARCLYADSIVRKMCNESKLVGDLQNVENKSESDCRTENINDDAMCITENDTDSSDNSNDPDYNPINDNECNSLFDFPKVSVKKKKFKNKRGKTKLVQVKGNKSAPLRFKEDRYLILGRDRKVRFYEVDDTIREIIGNNLYTCDMCKQVFTTFFDYYDHQETHNGEYIFNCKKCNKVFDKRASFVEHTLRHKIPCKVCELEVLPKSMPAHLLIHTDIHKCLECGLRHTSNASLEKHIKARHNGIKGFVCHICGKQSSCQSSMNRHMGYHSTERPYKCKYCEFSAKSLNIVQVHTSRKHFAETCVCEICAKLFKSQPSLNQHMKRIHTPRKHKCEICGKAFIERYNLNRHLKRHAGQRLHECKLCGKEFFTVRKLKEHMHSHRQGCVNCPQCGKEFFYKKYYAKHVLKCLNNEQICNENIV